MIVQGATGGRARRRGRAPSWLTVSSTVGGGGGGLKRPSHPGRSEQVFRQGRSIRRRNKTTPSGGGDGETVVVRERASGDGQDVGGGAHAVGSTAWVRWVGAAEGHGSHR